VVKHSELAPEFHKYKGRVVFLGNQVKDQDDRAATFREMQSGTNLMSAGKFLDIIGASPGCDVEIADALQAYTQCELGGDETWVELPRDQFPKTWKQFRRPVVRLRLALYGHPLSGAFWEQYCATQLKKVGFEQIPQWEGCYALRRLGLVLSVYVDDFKLAGRASSLADGWKAVRSVLNMDEPTPLGKYLGCGHSISSCSSDEVQQRLKNVLPYCFPEVGGDSAVPKNPKARGDPVDPKQDSPPKTCSKITYEMQGFLEQSVERYCELANCDVGSLKKASTPFLDDGSFLTRTGKRQASWPRSLPRFS
jgi:hypothetical protein